MMNYRNVEKHSRPTGLKATCTMLKLASHDHPMYVYYNLDNSRPHIYACARCIGADHLAFVALGPASMQEIFDHIFWNKEGTWGFKA